MRKVLVSATLWLMVISCIIPAVSAIGERDIFTFQGFAWGASPDDVMLSDAFKDTTPWNDDIRKLAKGSLYSPISYSDQVAYGVGTFVVFGFNPEDSLCYGIIQPFMFDVESCTESFRAFCEGLHSDYGSFIIEEPESGVTKAIWEVETTKIIATLVETDDPYRSSVNIFYVDTATCPFQSAQDVADYNNSHSKNEIALDREAASIGYSTIETGSKGDAVVALQQQLIELGYLSSKADGDYGKGTAAAVSKFQEAEGIEPTGVADPDTQAALFAKKVIPAIITSVKVKRNSAGTSEVYVVVKNTSKSATIDAFDFIANCYNAYGELIKGYGMYDAYTGTFQEGKVNPGKSSQSDWRWGMYGFDNTTNVEVALTRLHTTDGTTIDIAPSERVWVNSK